MSLYFKPAHFELKLANFLDKLCFPVFFKEINVKKVFFHNFDKVLAAI